jgi:hypothetical protein
MWSEPSPTSSSSSRRSLQQQQLPAPAGRAAQLQQQLQVRVRRMLQQMLLIRSCGSKLLLVWQRMCLLACHLRVL